MDITEKPLPPTPPPMEYRLHVTYDELVVIAAAVGLANFERMEKYLEEGRKVKYSRKAHDNVFDALTRHLRW